MAAGKRTSERAGTESPIASASPPTMISATSAPVPCAAPRSLVNRNPSSVSTITGHELPRRTESTTRRAESSRISIANRRAALLFALAVTALLVHAPLLAGGGRSCRLARPRPLERARDHLAKLLARITQV